MKGTKSLSDYMQIVKDQVEIINRLEMKDEISKLRIIELEESCKSMCDVEKILKNNLKGDR